MTTNEKAGTVATVSDLRNHLIAGGNQSDFGVNYAEKTENLQVVLAEHLKRNKKIVRLHICFGCGKPKTPAKFSIYYGVCKSCLQEAKNKGKTAQSNFISRTINNFHKKLRGALQNA
jgi:recombinational DNA repair protein (RecF pathway)